MAEYQKTIITNAGISVLNRVLSGKATATFTRAVSSTDDLSGKTESELRAMTGFGSVMQNGVCSRYDIHSSNMVSLDLVFTNEGLGNSYMINAVGLYAKASDSSTEVLYAIARAEKDAKGNSLAEQMPAYAGNLTKFTISLYTQVGQANSVSVSITDEGVVKSINGGDATPDVNGDVVVDDSSHAKFIEAELIHGHLLVPLVDGSGNPITDPAGNQLVADEYLPKSIKLGNSPAIYPGTDNTIRLPVYTQAEVDAMLSTKADTTSVRAKDDVDAQTGLIYGMLAQNRLVTPLASDNGMTLLDESGNALMSETRAVTSINGKAPGADGNITIDDYYPKQAIDNRLEVKADLLQMEDEHAALQKQIADNAGHLGSVDDTLSQHAKQISQATGEGSYALDQISTGQTLTALSDGQGGYLTDEHGNALMSETRAVTSVNGKTPGADGNVNIDDYYSKQAIDNRLEVKADLLQMEDEHAALQEQITDNTSHLGTVDGTLGQHAEQISQATGEASYALDQISAGQVATVLSDGQGGYLTDEHGNALLTTAGRVSAVKLGGQTYIPDSTGNIVLDTYSRREINNLVDSFKLAIEQVKALIK